MSHKTIIITAGGIGKRMGGDLPKQFLKIGGQPILFHTIKRFYDFDNEAQILLTLPNHWVSFWKQLCTTEAFSIPHEVISGGEERYHSIQLALHQATGDLIAVHDGVRPFVSIETISRCFSCAEKNGSGIPALSLKESLRKISSEKTVSVNRSDYKMVQTPQVFKKELLIKAYQLPYHTGITDDASLVEELGVDVHLLEGNEENIKITTQFDLCFCDYLLQKN